jgi:diaminopimelate epimerase
MQQIKFYKVSGAGNDFVLIDNRENQLTCDLNNLAQELCGKQQGQDVDGMLLVEKSDTVDFKMRIFNSDGSEVDMCGNGARCIALFSYKHNIVGKDMVFETMAGNIEAQVTDENMVKLKMSSPSGLRLDFSLELEDRNLNINFLDTGVPHVVIFVDDIENTEVYKIGKAIRNHKEFAPAGTNINFVKIADNNKIYVRTYERGVEDETLACGTGSVASAIISGIEKNLQSPVSVITRGGSILNIYFDIIDKENINDVYLQGEAKIILEGEYKI